MTMKRIEDISGEVVCLCNPMFPLYLIRGEQPILIDSGVSKLARGALDLVRQVLGRQKLARIVLTHSHWDHTGALSAIAEKHQAEVLASETAVSLLEKENVIGFINRLNREFAKPEIRDSLPLLRKLSKLRPFGDGERIELGNGRSLLAIAAPGHTRCSQAYLIEPEGILFPGDAVGVVERDGCIRPLFLSNYRDYRNSLLKLSGLPVSILAFSHNRAITGRGKVEAYFERSIHATERWYEMIKKEVLSGKDENTIAEDFFDKEFSKTTLQSPREVFVINMVAMIRAATKGVELI